MKVIDISGDELSSALLRFSETCRVCILDSCGVGHQHSHLMIAGIEPADTLEFTSDNAEESLAMLERQLTKGKAAFFTIAYDFGTKIERLRSKGRLQKEQKEPDIFVSLFDTLIVHDYDDRSTRVCGTKVGPIVEKLLQESQRSFETSPSNDQIKTTSNFTRKQYVDAVETIKESIRCGDTYQANLTQQITSILPDGTTPEMIFARLRNEHPAPFAAILKRKDSTVVSASPERFFKISGNEIVTSPIKGTSRRGSNSQEDALLCDQLSNSEKDRAENTMIVDLLRNDLGRVCDYGSVAVEGLCEVEEHPTLFHLVSTIKGRLREGIGLSDLIRALFPCGSISGAPKIRTMEILDEIETVPRGLSMGAIGYFLPVAGFEELNPGFDLSVAIRTMVIRGQEAVFNVGGGITIDSDAEAEYDESMLKAKALLVALGNKT